MYVPGVCLALLTPTLAFLAPITPLTKEEKKRQKDFKNKLDDFFAQKQRASWNQPKPKAPELPAHIKNASHARFKARVGNVLEAIPFHKRGGCGTRIPAKQLGLKPKALASLLALTGPADDHPGRESFSVPGAGINQVLKDEGKSTHGSVDDKEPFVTVFKDGWFEVGCFNDVMNTKGDKFGNEKDKYNSIGDVSIARYEELVLKDEQKPMTPTVCYEFCRSLPDMVFFGINNGRHCYCAPYYQPGPGDDKKCDVGCEGESTSMCGNADKSTIFEMHLCADTVQDLADAMGGAKAALDFFFEQTVLTFDLGKKMAEGGAALEKEAGKAGAPDAADNGMAAKKASKALSQAYQEGLTPYTNLLKAYKDGDLLKDADFSMAVEQTKAEHATAAMKGLTGPVMGIAESMFAAAKLGYPAASELLGEEPDPADGAGVALAKDDASFDFMQAAYSLDKSFPPGMSSCSGPIIDSPIVGLSAFQCGKVCEATTYPTKCVAFSSYSVEVDSGLSTLCFLLSDIKTLQTYECPDAEDCLPPLDNVGESCAPSAVCMVKMSEVSTGYKPKAEWKKTSRCFGSPATKDFTAYEMPALESKAQLLGTTELEAAP
eukprot:gnl/MRDRNA2_/MRDRNA2_119924_c0_seq1.p1 gnl/MRDRNA2_/MRDRNA2_119924_c0~~gnl/MRDRNA2_/MRDRNA2_119924_c0_seq1.p1  ORF type:complete len:603 (+),score=164.49 gnl/MRDRNA2_/MRDRNA2_119924_c0_seq1:71-1879(+)